MGPSTIDRLEQLSRLRAQGALTEAEFDIAKAALLNETPHPEPTAPPAGPPPPASASRSGDSFEGIAGQRLSPTWKFRFVFLSEHGLPTSAAFVAAEKTLPFSQKLKLRFSSLAFFFGPIYFLILGLWRPAVTLFAGSIVFAIICTMIGLSDTVYQAALLGYGALYALTCVPLYYLKTTEVVHRWNPFFWTGTRRP